MIFSGAKKLGESGYWTLTSLTPPELTPALKAGNKGVKLGIIEGESKQEVTPVVMEVITMIHIIKKYYSIVF